MKKGINFLLLAGVLSLSTLTCTAMADASGAYGEWDWTAPGQTPVDYPDSVTVRNKISTNYIFAITNGSDYIDLMQIKYKAGADIEFTPSQIKAKDITSGIDKILSLTNGYFTFAFKNNNEYSKLYSWEVTEQDNEGTVYKISDRHYSVYYTTSTEEPSPVPVPGAAMLLGSGLLGLVGIRSRFNRLA